MSEVLLDIDGERKNLREVVQRVKEVAFILEVKTIVYVKSTTNGFHVVIDIDKDLDEAVILALQSILLSDWRRETFNIKRFIENGKATNILFDRKVAVKGGKVVRVLSEESEYHE